MKVSILSVLLLSSVALFGQNALFIPFGQSNAEVKEYLENREYFHSEQIESADEIVKKLSSRQQVAYKFHDKVLYTIEDKRVFKNKKDAENTIKSCLGYLHHEKERVYSISDKAYNSHHVVVFDSRIVELCILHNRKEKNTTILLKSTSRMYGPRMQTEEFVASLD